MIMSSPKERFLKLKNDAESCLRGVALEKFGNQLAEEVIRLVKELDDEKGKLKDSEFPYTEMFELQDSKGKFFIGYDGSSIIKKVGLPLIVPDVYHIVREKLHQNCKNIQVTNLGKWEGFGTHINYEENFRFSDYPTLRLFAAHASSYDWRSLKIDRQKFRPYYWTLMKYFGIGNI